MDARSLGPDAPAVPMLGYGAMPLSLIGRPDEADSIAVLHRVFDAGVRLIDTADSYCIEPDEVGHNERLVAKGTGELVGRARYRPGGHQGWLGQGRCQDLARQRTA